MKIHYLQHVSFEGLASIERWAVNHHHALSATRFYANDPIPHVDDVDWVIVMGGPMNIHEDAKYPWLIEEKRFIERAIEQNKTVIGVCLGAQLIANVLGAKVYRGQHKEIGWFPIEKTADAKRCPIFTSLPQTFNVFHWLLAKFLEESEEGRSAQLEAGQGSSNSPLSLLYKSSITGISLPKIAITTKSTWLPLCEFTNCCFNSL